MAFETEKAQAAEWGYVWNAADPYNWQAIAGRISAEQNGWAWDPADPLNWKHIAAAQAAQTTDPATATKNPAIDPVAAEAGEDTTAADTERAFAQFAQMINEAGLGELFSYTNGKPSGWLWDQLVAGAFDTEAGMMAALETTDVWQNRYRAITELRAQAASGMDVYVPSMREVISYEKGVEETFTRASVPPHLFDTFEERQQLMIAGFSIPELETRVGQGWERVINAPASVRKFFDERYGIDGDAQLLGLFLDRDQSVAKLERASKSAYTRGMGQGLNLSIDELLADRIAELPMTDAGIVTQLTSAAELQGLTTESIGESATDLDDTDLIESSFFGDDPGDLQRRLINRQAAGKFAAGGAALTNQGVSI